MLFINVDRLDSRDSAVFMYTDLLKGPTTAVEMAATYKGTRKSFT